ncbi:MAG: YczE/YyaS/YitT family protein [Bacilli bacterium]
MKYIRLVCGYLVFSIGIAWTIQANIGLSPWDVLHSGFAERTHLTIGVASIIVSVAIVALNVLLGERIGLGTVLNAICIGLFLDVILFFELIPLASNFLLGLVYSCFGMFLIGIGSWLYLGAGLGAGPRDGLMIGLAKRLGKPVGIVRSSIEVSALVVGFLLGGHAGFGTLFMGIGIGYFVSLAFKIVKFNPQTMQHLALTDLFRREDTLNGDAR